MNGCPQYMGDGRSVNDIFFLSSRLSSFLAIGWIGFWGKKITFFFHLPLQSVNRYKVLSCHKLRSAIHLLQSFHMCIDRHFPGDHLALDGSEWVNWTCRMHMPWAIYRNRYVMLNLQKMVWYHSPKGWKFMDYAIVCSIRMTLKKIIILS